MRQSLKVATRAQAFACYTPPFRYHLGYIFDAESHMVADTPQPECSAVARVRGWGRLQYRKDCDPETLQDTVGQLIAEALTRFWGEERRDG